MAITAPIPQPQSGIDAFDTGMKSMQEMLDSIRLNAYRQSTLKLNQTASEREDKLLPGRLQEYADRHNLQPGMLQEYDDKHREALSKLQDSQHDRDIENMLLGGGNLPPNNNGATNSSPQPINPNDANAGIIQVPPPINQGAQGGQAVQPQAAPQMTQPNNSENSPLAALKAQWMQAKGITPITQTNGGMTAAPDMLAQDNPDDNRQALPPINPDQNAVQRTQAQVAPAIQQATPQTNSGFKYPTQPGEQVVIDPGNPRFSILDTLPPGTKIGKHITISAPKIDKGNDGVETWTYPSGKKVLVKSGLSNEEKVEQKLTADQQREEAKQKNRMDLDEKKKNDAEATKLEDAGTSYANVANAYVKASQLLDKNPHLTGLGYAVPYLGNAMQRAGGKDLGDFNSYSGAIQAEKAKQTTGNRTGRQSLNWAAVIKPDAGKTPETNRGFIQGGLEQIVTAFKNDKDRYERITGKKYPFELPKEVNDILDRDAHNMVTIRNKDTGKQMTVTRAEYQKLIGAR